MFERSNFVTCGEVVKTHGKDGQIKVNFVEQFAKEYQKGDWLFVEISKKPVPFFIEGIDYTGDNLPVIKLEDITSPEAALGLVKKALLFPLESLGSWAEDPLNFLTLKGYELFDQTHHFKGVIKEIALQTDQFLFTIEQPNGATSLFPCHSSWVKDLDRESGYLIVDLPEGLETL